MNWKFHIILSVALIVLASCKSAPKATLSPIETKLCDSLGFDLDIVLQVKSEAHATTPVLDFVHEKKGEFLDDRTEGPLHAGLLLNVDTNLVDLVVEKLRDGLRHKGYTLFVLDHNFGINNQPDQLALVKDTSLTNILHLVGTGGYNYDIDTDSLIVLLDGLRKQYPWKIKGIGFDWCEFDVIDKTTNWNQLAQTVFTIAPDVVTQGTETVPALASELQKSHSIYFWWD